MLENYLPFLKKRESQEKKPNPAGSISDDSLFFNTSSLKQEATSAGLTMKFASGVVAFFSVSLMVLLAANAVLNLGLNRLLNEQKNLEYKLSGYTRLENEAKSLAERIDYSKRTVGTRKPLTARISFVMTRLSPSILLVNSRFSSSDFEISVKSTYPMHITTMFLNWLKDGGITEVTLKEAVFESSENVYLVKLSGVYR